MAGRPLRFTLLAALLIAGLSAQDQPPTFRTEANYVRVDVYPTANGVPVLDLRKEDFEVFDSNQPQAVDTFEHVVVHGQVPQESRREPATVAESRAVLQNPRARVFVLFLDFYHVDTAGSRNMRKTLVDSLDRALDAEDLIGVMTPEMSARDVSFARKTTTIAGMLEKHWDWGERNDRLAPPDPEDQQYRQCYARYPEIAEEMIERRHETLTLNALEDLVRFLRNAREERKAILAISNGWRLFQRNVDLMKPLDGNVPGAPVIGINPRNGRPTAKATGIPQAGNSYDCDRDRVNLAQIDDQQQFRDIIEEANRSNASFYPIDPRGLAVFDEPIVKIGGAGPPPLLPPSVDAARLRARNDSLRTLAADTDGVAVVQTNNLTAGLNRVVTDLSSYYLLGYYSTAKLDGRFHPIRVRVKRPGVQVRARRGYLAASAADLTAAANRAAAAATPLDAAALEAKAVDAALAPLNSLTRERPLRLHAVSGWRPGAHAVIWAVGEVSSAPEWKAGADVDVMLTHGTETLATTHVQVAPGARSFSAALGGDRKLEPGDYGVSVRVRGRAADAMPAIATMVVPLRPQPSATAAILIRRGPTTGNKDMPTADVRFRRTEQIRVEVPAIAGEPPAARLLDRMGKPLPVPVSAAVRDDANGARWHTAQLTLAPLAPGDYVIEIAAQAGTERSLVAFRVVP